MDFATLPPEINSGLMYSGPGAGSMMRAAAAWQALATRLYAAAADYREATAPLAGAGGDRAHSQTATRYVDWLEAVAARSERAGAQLKAAAGAHQSALTAMAPPPVIAGNRAHRMSLASANCLGHNSTAIATVDAEYDAMWAQDARAMYTYARLAAGAATMAPFPAPPGKPAVPTRDWALRSAPDVISAGGDVMSVIPGALEELSSPPPKTIDAFLSPVTASLSKLNSLTATSDFAIGHLNSVNKTAALQSLLRKPAATNGVHAKFGRATTVGVLSAPRAWAAAAPLFELPRGDRAGEPIRLVGVSEPHGSPAAREFGG